ncbi:MAG: ABC transporter permease [Gemmatimonadota bacterium]|nr:ABC transporter permease [Gemmatimonadota bacterium]
MLGNYLTLAFRSILKNKLTSLINLGGLSVALAFGTLAVVFAYNELTYDLFHDNADRIYRIRQRSGDRIMSRTAWPLGPAIANEIPDATVVRVFKASGSVAYGEKSSRFRVSYVDPTFLDVFSFPMARGDASTALHDVRSIVITERVARRLFLGEDPLGKVVTINKKDAYTITGVLSGLPENSSVVFDCLVPAHAADKLLNSWASVRVQIVRRDSSDKVPGEIPDLSWMIQVATTFVYLPEHLHPRNVEERLPRVVQRAWGRHATGNVEMTLQPLREVRFDRHTQGAEPASNPVYIYVFLGIALVVITITCVNYSALAIGRALSRAKEAGVRRLFGAGRRQFVSQYLSESVFMALIALVLGLGLVSAILPHFNSLVGARISMMGQLSATTLLCIVLVTLAVGISAGLYPALVLSRLQPADVLYARPESVNPGFLMRLLLVVQFAMSMTLMMVAVVMAAQLNLLATTNPGFRTDGVIAVNTWGLREISPGLVDAYAQKITAYPDITGVAQGQHPLSNKKSIEGFARAEGRTVRGVETIAVDYGFLETLEFKMLEGRDFSRSRSTDQDAVIINQTLMKQFGWQSAAGRDVDWNGNGDVPIIGVVRDFHFKSFHQQVAPAVIFVKPEFCDLTFVVSTSGKNREILDILRKEWQEIAPSQPFRARFLEDDLKNQYKKDEKWLDAIRLPAILALGLACLGAFGLTAFSVARRTKEIGIRKVFGTSISRLMARLSIDFTKILILAAIVAGPIAYIALKEWLESYVYRIDLIAPIIAGAVLTSAFVMLAVSCKTYRAATLNPANTLRDE